MSNGPIILFDGVCNLCNSSVQFVIRHDPLGKFRFASLQSITGQQLLQQHHLPLNNFSSFVLIEDGKAYTQSTGALKATRHLKGLWKMLYGFIIVPAFIRNSIYNWIANNRYKWFGRQDSCMIPTPALKARFLE